MQVLQTMKHLSPRDSQVSLNWELCYNMNIDLWCFSLGLHLMLLLLIVLKISFNQAKLALAILFFKVANEMHTVIIHNNESLLDWYVNSILLQASTIKWTINDNARFDYDINSHNYAKFKWYVPALTLSQERLHPYQNSLML